MTKHGRIEPPGGQESVWDYPRPPRMERCSLRLRVVHHGIPIADVSGGWRVLETSHPPVYYLAPEAVGASLRPNDRTSYCEFKGMAHYWDIVDGQSVLVRDAAWSYPLPNPAFASLAGHLAFYAGRVDACYVGDERVTPQPGDFYGGWITARIVGPFKGVPGSWGW